MHIHFHANQTHFHLNGFVRGLVLKVGQSVTRKWPITSSRELLHYRMLQVFIIVFFVRLDVEINDPETFSMLDSPQMTSVLVKDLKYFTKQGG